MTRGLLLAAVLAGAQAFLALGASGEMLRAELVEAELPQDSLKTFLGTVLRSEKDQKAPEGYDYVYRFKPAAGGRSSPLVLLEKLEGGGKVSVHLQTATGPVALPVLGKGLFGNTKAFGPVRTDLPIPPLYVHACEARVPSQPVPDAIYLLPASMLAGEVILDGRRVKVAVLDANLDGVFGKACVEHLRDGDWFAADADGDGTLLIDASGREGRPLTNSVTFEGRTWAWKLEGRTLTMEPARLKLFQVRFEGLPDRAVVRGWSTETGSFTAETRGDGSFELPEAKTTLQGYSFEKDGFFLSGGLRRTVGVREGGESPEATVTVGPPVTPKLSLRWNESEACLFSAQFTGKAGETLTILKDGKRVPPAVLVLLGPDGTEVHRATMTYG